MRVWLNRIAKSGAAITGGFIAATLMADPDALQWLGTGSKPEQDQTQEFKSELYIWGNGVRTPRSDYLGLYPTFEPTKIETFDGVNQPFLKSIVLGEGFEGGVDLSGNLLVWESEAKPAYLEEGHPPKLLTTRTNIKTVAKDVRQAGFCDQGLWILHNDGSVSRLQVNTIRDADFNPTKVYFAPQPEKVGGIIKVAKLAFGESHILALDQDGLVSCYGDDTLGQCGQGAKGRSPSGPYVESSLKEFTRIDSIF
jgi:alpha-tubulin suppressor-like RCC1 family protein